MFNGLAISYSIFVKTPVTSVLIFKKVPVPLMGVSLAVVLLLIMVINVPSMKVNLCLNQLLYVPVGFLN